MPPTDSNTYPIAPLSVEPALGTGSHVTVLYIDGPQIHVALLIRNKVAHIADTAYLSWPLTQPTRHWALWRHMPHGYYCTVKGKHCWRDWIAFSSTTVYLYNNWILFVVFLDGCFLPVFWRITVYLPDALQSPKRKYSVHSNTSMQCPNAHSVKGLH